jgi:hypothetical protein
LLTNIHKNTYCTTAAEHLTNSIPYKTPSAKEESLPRPR